MTVNDVKQMSVFHMINDGTEGETEIKGLFCCDLLSIAMGKLPYGAAWVTVMANINTLAVASLAEAACVILAEGVELDQISLAKAKAENITVFGTEMPIFEAALAVYKRLDEGV